MSDLKPCPFCGDEAEIVNAYTALRRYRAACRDCGAWGRCGDTIESAATAWNTRADSAALAAAVQAEREACAMIADFYNSGLYDGNMAKSIAEDIRSRGPAVVCQECNGERWHEYQNPLTGEITNRTPCAACNGAEEVPGPAPAVDDSEVTDADRLRWAREAEDAHDARLTAVRIALDAICPGMDGNRVIDLDERVTRLGAELARLREWWSKAGEPRAPAVDVLAVVREYVEAKDALQLCDRETVARANAAESALRALVSPTTGEHRRCTCDYDHVNDDEHRPWCGGPKPEAKDGGASHG